jgi:hypothetical protein
MDEGIRVQSHLRFHLQSYIQSLALPILIARHLVSSFPHPSLTCSVQTSIIGSFDLSSLPITSFLT